MVRYHFLPWTLVVLLVVGIAVAAGPTPGASAVAPSAISSRSASGGTGSWSALGGGADGGVMQLVRYGDILTVGGNVDFVGGLSTPAHVGQWDGTTWTPLGSSAGSGTTALARDALGNVYRALNQAQVETWNGAAWVSAVSSNPNNFINAMMFTPQGDLLIGGSFSSPAPNVARWNGSSWSGFGSGPGFGIGDLALASDDTLYAVGYTSPGIKKWDGVSWTTYAGGMTTGKVMDSVAVDDSAVYVGGGFTALNNISLRNIAVNVDGVWSPLGFGLGNTQAQYNYVNDLVYDDTSGLLYVAGSFTYACGDAACSSSHDDTVAVPYVAAWYPARQAWIPLAAADGTSLNDTAFAIALSDDGRTVFAGGTFYLAGGILTRNIAAFTWDAPSISALSPSAVPENTAATVTITGQDFETLRGITVDGVDVPYVQVDDTTAVITLPAGTGARQVRALAAGGMSAPATFTFQAPIPPAPVPAGAPRGVQASPGDGSAVVAWESPDSAGSYPITHYRAVASPGGQQCVTTQRTCTITGLSNGTTYTFTVSALTGAGWGESSTPSGPVVPERITVTITGIRSGRSVSVEGTTTGFGAAIPHVRRGSGSLVEGSPRVIQDGRFTWQRRATAPLTVYFTVGDARSNALRL